MPSQIDEIIKRRKILIISVANSEPNVPKIDINMRTLS